MAMLEVKNLNVFYGKIHAVTDVSLRVNEGEIACLIGANGAGKTSLLRAVMNQIPSQGEIFFKGESIHARETMGIVRMGMTLVPEGRRVFPRSSVQDNLLLGSYAVKNRDLAKAGLESVYTMFPTLKERRKQLAGTLSGGEQQMLAMGRALMSSPKLLLLDEPSMGLSPKLVDQVFETIVSISRMGTTILLVEQNANQTLQIADKGYVIETGHIVLSDSAAALGANSLVKEAYLGG